MRTAHLTAVAGALVALAATATAQAVATDTIATPRHVLSLDLSRLQPFARTYDMVVYAGDSAHVIGQRDVTLVTAFYVGQPAWLMYETRTGIVPTVDSLFLALDLRPLHWSSALGKSRLGVEFSGDSIYGVAITPAARRNLILGSRPDLLVSTAMIEVLAGLLPLTSDWSDSAAVLAVDAGDAVVVPVELAVTGEEPGGSSDSTSAGTWLLAVRGERGQLQLWIDKGTRQVSRLEQTLPGHVGSRLEYRTKTAQPAAPPQ